MHLKYEIFPALFWRGKGRGTDLGERRWKLAGRMEGWETMVRIEEYNFSQRKEKAKTYIYVSLD